MFQRIAAHFPKGRMNPDEALIRRILLEAKTLAVIGCSTNPNKPSGSVPQYLQSVGYRVIPVNPTQSKILGEVCYPDLRSIPERIDVVDLFRPAAEVPLHVDQAIEIGARFVWMQLGILHEGAAAMARAAGIEVVMNRCMRAEHLRLFG